MGSVTTGGGAVKPLNLTATNFRSYPELKVPLASLQLATLCGENGAGKSSVLKSMLFALFGPEPGLSLDDYIRTGETETRVEFEFALGGSSYRIIRARKSNGKSGKTSLELARRNGAGWEPVTGDTIQQTQQRIEETLCLDLDGFLKSAWISQGDADAFTRAKPTERKQVLAGILDLAIYGRLQDAAKKRLRAIEDEVEKLRGKLDMVEDQLLGKGQLVVDAREARDKAQALQYGIEELEKELDKWREEEKRLAGVRAKAEAANEQLKAVNQAGRDLTQKSDTLLAQEVSLQALRRQLPDLESEAARRTHLQAQITELDETATRWHEVNKQRLELREQWQEAMAALERAGADLAGEEVTHAHLAAERNLVEEKLNNLAGGEVHQCPTCQQEIKDAALEATRQTFKDRLEDKIIEVGNSADRIERLTEIRDDAQLPLATLEEQGTALPTVEYDQGEHDGLKRQLAALDGVEAQLAQARGADSRVNEIRAERETIRQQLEQIGEQKAELEKSLEQMNTELVEAATAAHAASSAAASLSTRRREYDDASQSQARLEAQIERLDKLESESTKDRRRQGDLTAQAATWQFLVQAFGKDGIPALIIDAAIPEVEDIANDILTRLGTGLEVKLETLKALKSSDRIAETLDVKIIEDGFDRPYETYSGGEAYRVNVALRVALSKLLARRAGAHIETLILDEPEGLDEEGRAKLVELLQILSETFSTILLISHHEDLREVFPARIECRKGPDGSRADVVGDAS